MIAVSTDLEIWPTPPSNPNFYRAAYMQGGLSNGKGVRLSDRWTSLPLERLCLSVCPSVCPSHA